MHAEPASSVLRPPSVRARATVRRPSVWRRLVAVIALWGFRSRSRRALSELNERELRDIGIDQSDAARESAKVFWRT